MKIDNLLPRIGSFGIVSLLLIFIIAWLSFNSRQKKKVSETYLKSTPDAKPVHHLKGSFEDPRDGQRYNTINLFGRIWMSQNLNYNDGNGNSWCYEEDEGNCKTYGRLYSWKAARAACPEGWRLPVDRDWNEVYIRLGHVAENYDALIKGGYMGFDALFAGWRAQDLSYQHLGKRAYFWSNTLVDNAYARYYRLDTEKKKLSSDNAYKELAFSCRCVKE